MQKALFSISTTSCTKKSGNFEVTEDDVLDFCFGAAPTRSKKLHLEHVNFSSKFFARIVEVGDTYASDAHKSFGVYVGPCLADMRPLPTLPGG